MQAATQVMFYVLNDPLQGSSKDSLQSASQDSSQGSLQSSLQDNQATENALNHLVCMQAAYFYRNNQKVFIYTQNQESAHNIDEMLWAFEPTSFVPHSLVGEGPKYGAPVEISWQAPINRRPILINLTSNVPEFSNQFSTIIDFVPTDETLKQLARERFRHYRNLGFTVNNQTAPQVVESK